MIRGRLNGFWEIKSRSQEFVKMIWDIAEEIMKKRQSEIFVTPGKATTGLPYAGSGRSLVRQITSKWEPRATCPTGVASEVDQGG
jgi:hypothetical protein